MNHKFLVHSQEICTRIYAMCFQKNVCMSITKENTLAFVKKGKCIFFITHVIDRVFLTAFYVCNVRRPEQRQMFHIVFPIYNCV